MPKRLWSTPVVLVTRAPTSKQSSLPMPIAISAPVSSFNCLALTGAEIAIGVLDAPRVEGKMELKAAKGLSAMLLGAVSKFGRFETFKPDILLKEGDRVESLSVLDTPGHTDGSICLYRERAFMFVGDALRGDDNGGVQPPSDNMTYD